MGNSHKARVPRGRRSWSRATFRSAREIGERVAVTARPDRYLASPVATAVCCQFELRSPYVSGRVIDVTVRCANIPPRLGKSSAGLLAIFEAPSKVAYAPGSGLSGMPSWSNTSSQFNEKSISHGTKMGSRVSPYALDYSKRRSGGSTARQHCVFVDATQQTIAAASGDDTLNRPTKRKRTTSKQLDRLLASFAESDSPSYDVRESLAAECNMSNREVQVWFQNRRAKVLRDRAKLSGDDVASDSSAAEQAPEDRVHIPSRTKPAKEARWRSDGVRQPVPAGEGSQLPGREQGGNGIGRLFIPARSTAEVWHEYQRQHRGGFLSPDDVSTPFDVRTPSPLSASSYTPSLASPGSASTSSYFSVRHEPMTPLSENAPANAFFRLALDSPARLPASQDPFEKAASRFIASGLVSASDVPASRSSCRPGLPSFAELSRGVAAPRLPPISRSLSAPSSPTAQNDHTSRRVPSLRNLLNPEPASSYPSAQLERSLSFGDRDAGSNSTSSTRRGSLRRPSLGQRFATFHGQLAPIMSRSPSRTDLEQDSEERPSGITPLAANFAYNEQQQSAIEVPATSGRPVIAGAGLGILAAAADFVGGIAD